MLQTREAVPADYTVIQQIAHDTWPATYGNIITTEQMMYMLDRMYSIAALENQVNNQQHHFIIASDGATDLGFASYELHYRQQPQTKIHKIYVLPAAQGKGIGKLLMDKVAETALANNNSHLLLNVNRFNKAIDFYKRTGFEVIGEEDIDIGNGFLMEDYIMRKPL